MKRFLLTWAVLSPAHFLAAGLSSWFLLHRMDLTYEAMAAWIVVSPVQSLVLSLAIGRRDERPAFPRIPLGAALVLCAGVAIVAVGLVAPPGGAQPLVRRLLALAAGALLVAALFRRRLPRPVPSALLGALLLAVGADAFFPWLERAPRFLWARSLFVPGLIAWGGLLGIGIVLAVASSGEKARREAPWASLLLQGAAAVAFVDAHAAALNYVRRPVLVPPWDALVPAAATFAASLLLAAAVAFHAAGPARGTEGRGRGRAFLRGLVVGRDFFLALALLPFVLPLWLLPWRPALALARFYGLLGFVAWGTARRAGLVNLRRAFGPSLTRAAALRDVARVFAGLGQSMAEGIQFSRRYRTGDGLRDLVEVEDPELAARLLADPSPKVFVTGHLGSWEVAIQILERVTSGPGAAIVRRVDNPFLQALVLRLRARNRDAWIEKTGAAAEALAKLRAGTSVAILLDENGGCRGPFVPFFGRPASTRKTAALLSAATGASLVVGAVVRRKGPRPFLFRLALFPPPPGGPADAAGVLDATRRIVETWEAWVREDPLQWRWIHWRWKARPDGTEETYTRRDVELAFAGQGES